jgi:predicted SprT family Zn-dependent metalloprotease
MRPEIKELRLLSKKYGVKVRLKRLKGAIAGQAYYEDNLIIINSLLSNRIEILSVFFHEWAHLDCYNKGLWRKYHESEDSTEKLKVALKAERYIDRIAEFEMYAYDRRLRYLRAYDTSDKEAKEFLEKYYNDET